MLFDGEVMAGEGFGVRALGEDAAVDADPVVPAGGDREVIGHSREAVLERLRLYSLGPFRMQHAYGNFRFTAAVLAAAARAGVTWAEGSRQLV